jgi:hypothetical protein
VYDMYQWDQPDADGPVSQPSAAMNGARRPGRDSVGERGPAAQAVQVALDRRDNGGDSGAACGQ